MKPATAFCLSAPAFDTFDGRFALVGAIVESTADSEVCSREASVCREVVGSGFQERAIDA